MFITQGKNNWKYILIVAILAAIIGGGIFWLSKQEIPITQFPFPKVSKRQVIVTTEKDKYEYIGEAEGAIKLTVKNNLDKSICFESCNTYYLLEKMGDDWEELDEKLCEFITVKKCVKPAETEIFEYITIWKQKGIYKFAVPICIDCENLYNASFRYDETIYSNEFTVTKLNVVEVTNLSLKVQIDQNDISSYQSFIKNNKQYSKPTSQDEIYRQINQAREYLRNYPEGKAAENLREKIIQGLNMGFLLEGINERELIVTTIGVREHEEYTEKELLFRDPEVGTFSALLLIPNKQQESYPAIVGLHGHGDSKEIFKQQYFGEDLAKNGFVVIMPSFRAMNCDEVERDISKELLLDGFTLMGLRIYETHLLIKYLNYKDFVDENKIGIIGHSGGSHTATLVSRISQDIKAGVYDYDSFMLDLCIEKNPDIHCQTVPSLAYYDPQINDRSTLGFPFRKFEYKYPGPYDKQEVIDFFKEKLME